jgi:HEPN domain-containing protein
VTWEPGRADIEHLLRDGKLEQVTPSEEVASRLLADAEGHVGLAAKGIEEDPSGALQLSYDAARKASAALLAVQGLRSTTRGGHVAVIDAVRSQFGHRHGMEVFAKLHRLRRRRHASEYPDADSPEVTKDDARQALATAREALNAAKRLLDSGRVETFE